MNKKKKGFTLIELLAVIVILGVLLAIAIPSVSKYISASKKSTYVSNAQSYVEAVINESLLSNYLPINKHEGTILSFSKIRELIQKGGKTSPYGTEFVSEKSFVLIVNVSTAESPVYKYYITAIDEEGYGIGEDSTSALIEYDELKNGNIVQLGKGNGTTIIEKGKQVSVKYKGGTITVSVIDVQE